ncbi:MAG: methionyl-tRNA formyltransferase [Candidatus Gastranaerophilales bacterium]|nr:methionyl-tRNA formyltransferase [Candidatus Gastranaerophilales bacterium]
MTNNKKLKIIFVGMPDMAVICLNNLLEKKFNIVGVIPPEKTHETYNTFINFTKVHKLNIIDFEKTPNEKECIEKIKKLNADIGVVCSYNCLLNADFLKTTKLGYINAHPSLLPDYRGAMPYFHIIKNGEKKSGVTLHFMDETFDTGDIIYQEVFDLLPWETMGTLFNRTNYMISDALIKVLSDYENGIDFKRIPQSKSSFYIKAPKTDGHLKIRWNKKPNELYCLIKACNPFFNAFTSFRNTAMKVMKASPIEYPHKLPPGQIAQANENSLLVACQGGYLSIEILQLATWGVFSPKEFYYTFTPTTEEFLT